MRRIVILSVLVIAAVSVVVVSCLRREKAPLPTRDVARSIERDAPERARGQRPRVGDAAAPDAATGDAVGDEETVQPDAVTLPLEVTFHDSETWAPLVVEIGAHTTGGSAPVVRSDGSWAFDAGVDDGALDLRLEVDPPDGYVAPEVSLRDEVSPLATALRASIAVAPEARIVVHVVDESGAPVEGADVVYGVDVVNAVEGDELDVSVVRDDGLGRTDAAGVLRLRDIAFARDRSIVFQATHDGRRSHGTEARLTHRDDEIEVRLALLPTAAREHAVIKDATISDHNEIDRDQHDGPSPRLRVTVYRRDGRAAAGVSVQPEYLTPNEAWAWLPGAETDEVGTADVVASEAAGTYRITASAIGFVPTTQEVTLSAGRGLETVAIHESRGRRVLVRVIDADGQPVPFAEVRAWTRHGRFYAMDGDRQRLDLHADLRGELVLANAPLGGLRLSAEYGDRSARGVSEVGNVSVLRLVRSR